MIEEKFVDLYARNSGIRDKLIAERDVVLTYALNHLKQTKLLDHIAFKGGTCLRKMVFGSSGRFSEDLDFTLSTSRKTDDVLVDLVEVLNQASHGIQFDLEDHYEADGGRSFGGDVEYRHSWNSAGRFHLQVSLREEPTLPLAPLPMKPQGYFKYLEFELFDVPSLQPIEMISEKIRAAFQRAKVRDLYDLYRFSSIPFNGELLRALVVLKLWQVRDPFDPDRFFKRIESSDYDWDDLRRFLRTDEKIDAAAIKKSVMKRFASLSALTPLEQQVVADSKNARNKSLADQLRKEVKALFNRLP